MHRYAVALGSNLGNRLGYLRRGVELLKQEVGALDLLLSRVYDTDPLGGPVGQGAYLNAATVFRSELEPTEVLERLLDIERREGRVRRQPNDPRTLDLDLLLCDNLRLERPGLVIPHPRMHLRAFVLAPLADIAPGWVVPGLDQSVEALLGKLDTAGIRPTDLRL
ncbi:2-amino-4-hydroxy-6-hydroxymethyldihydropteridine diphosphokinase [Calidithermus timidus]|uniref:2-amino-4-hydroxy-6- hydroxymethyldihydropteridine diphosphokinase n=1 Tax=Calidithermus timidus TaxID=307124 RepID=UPI000377AEF3|nr:2-amino-4-hydroxy-6-hydroxymethyldihydropteridine diphosphokinase [Calidithermus timidus]